MASKSPWSVKGVSQEDRDQAKLAARRAGVPVGVWLSQQIRAAESRSHVHDGNVSTSGEEEVKLQTPSRGQSSRGSHDSRFSFGPGQWSTATGPVEAGQFSRLTPHPGLALLQPVPSGKNAAAPHAGHHDPPAATHWGMPPLAHPMYLPQPPQTTAESKTPETASDAITELEKRLASVETKMSRDLRDVHDRLGKIDDLEKHVSSLQEALYSKAKSEYSTAPLERAITRLSERLQRIEDMVLPAEPTGGFFSRLFRRR